MLFNPFLNFNFLNFFKSGFYIDYFIKKVIELIIKNILIFSSLFFGEKFFIEFLTKKSVDNIIINLNKTKFSSFFINYFFFFIVFFFFYSIFFIEIFFLLF
jgi:hypothetical protein